MRRSYDQYCTLATALDVIGERWTLLIVRELQFGPRRFTQLLEGLPGMGRNLLAERLRYLESEQLVRRRELPALAGAHGYELTEDGRGLAPALTELARWGTGRLGPLRPGVAFRGRWVAGTMVAMANIAAARGVKETYELDLEGDVFHLRVDDGRVTPHLGSAEEPDLVIRTRVHVLVGIGTGELSVAGALASGDLAAEGAPWALEHCLAIFAAAWEAEPAAFA